jgi:hypothetical protein
MLAAIFLSLHKESDMALSGFPGFATAGLL